MNKEMNDKVEKNLAAITNHYDNEAETFFCMKVEEAYLALQKVSELYEEIEATWRAWVREICNEDIGEVEISNNLYDKCVENFDDFEEELEELQACFKI